MLARWSSWGAIPQVFDERNEDWAQQRAQLAGLLSADDYDAARRTTINAHYTAPAIVREMWGALRELGFEGGDVLEPGSGAGTFIGMAPEGARMVGIELDATTAAIARGLYPHADIRTESFAKSRLSRGSFDATIGNVPFADVALHDREFNPHGHTMHNHFIVKSLELTRPGGMVAVLTSSFTMDAVNPAARRDMNELADLVGAVRLPSGAHRRSAGTEVVTDLLILRRRAHGEPKREREWETVTPVVVDDQNVKINTYFADHPQHVLGDLTVGTGMYGSATLGVRTDNLAATGERLHDALADIVSRARERGDVFTDLAPELVQERAAVQAVATELWDGTIVERDGEFKIARSGALDDLAVPRTQAAETRALLALRDGARDLIAAEAVDVEGGPALEAQRAELRDAYTAYVERFGALNRFTLRKTGRSSDVVDPMTGDPVIDAETGQVQQESAFARITPPAVRRLRSDPHMPLVMALERFDEETQESAPATLLSERVLVPRTPAQGAETAADAIAMSMDQTGTVELDTVAELLGVDAAEARALMGDLVFDDPTSTALIPAPEYLSGDVVTKLEQAEAAAADDDRFIGNVAALKAVQPEPIPLDQIEARLGAVWVSAELHQQFLREILKDRSVVVENPMPGAWGVRGQRFGVLATSEWGTERRPATEIAQAAMEQRSIVVKDKIDGPDGSTEVPNPVETAAAQEKVEAMQARFAEWVWEEPARAAELHALYNRRFNNIVLRDYTSAGDYLTLPGLSESFALRPHQRAAIARMVSEPAVGLFHGVGAGKTLEMVVGTTEMRRMGLISKPMVVVPNHMLAQFTREWLHAYPAARVLSAASDDLSGGSGTADARRTFVARAAANDWDAIILTQGAFKKVGTSAEFQADYMRAEVDELRAVLEAATEQDAMTVKRIEKAVLKAEARLEKQLDMPRDAGLSFEDMGVDYLVVDEAHMYKNLSTASNIPGAGIDGSKAATDLHMKLESLRARFGARVATFATATPIANSVTEAYVMQRYLRPDMLEGAGINSFDGWAATFGQTVTEMEVSPAGKFRQKARFAKFQNVPEMLRMWHVFADVKTIADLNLPVPAIAPRESDGKREVETVVIEPTSQLEEFFVDIGDRAEKVGAGRDPREDNMLKISSDGRAAALDYRLIDQHAPVIGEVKLDVVARRVLREWERTRDNEYIDTVTGDTSPIRGGLQLVFSDLGTPNEDRWDAYTELRRQLVRGGMAPDRVRFIHEAKTDADKARLFAAARAGHVSVLIGSTAKMGMGTNVQDRITAMHHVDCPWRPADVEQRDGRGIRQHNQNAEVSVTRYVVERSFDAYSWQTVARKAGFIAQIMRGRLDVREIEDIGDTALSATEAKALASGNPLLLEKASADAELQKLRRQETAHHRAQSALRFQVRTSSDRLAVRTSDLEELRRAQQRTVHLDDGAFAMEVAGASFDKRADAAAAIGEWAAQHYHQWSRSGGEPMRLGHIRGHDVVVGVDRRPVDNYRVDIYAWIALSGVPGSGVSVKEAEFRQAGVGLVTQLANRVEKIPALITHVEGDIATLRSEIGEAEQRVGRPFAHADALAAAQQTVAELDARIIAEASPAEPVDSEEPVRSEPSSVDERVKLGAAVALGAQAHVAPNARGGSGRFVARSGRQGGDLNARHEVELE